MEIYEFPVLSQCYCISVYFSNILLLQNKFPITLTKHSGVYMLKKTLLFLFSAMLIAHAFEKKNIAEALTSQY